MPRQKLASVLGFDSRRFWTAVALLIVFAAACWQYSRSRPAVAPSTTQSKKSTAGDCGDGRRGVDPNENEPLAPGFVPEFQDNDSVVVAPVDSQRVQSSQDANSLLVKNQTIRDQQGTVVFRGTVDLKPSLDRIHRGESNRHRNDGATFQNREGRLPRKPAGYYKEYVHPTDGESGPGPQRIIMGKEGEIWYTPDHYKTFLPIEPPG